MSLHGEAAVLCCWQQRAGEHRDCCTGSQGLWSVFPSRFTCWVFSPDCLLVLQLLIPSHLFVKLFVFLCLLASSSSFCLLGIYRFPRSQSVLFFCYRSLPCSWLPLHSFSPRGLALSPSLLQLSFFYLLPTFSANAVLFLIAPSYWFSVFSFFLFFLEKFPFSFQFFSPSAFPVMWHHTKNQCKKQCAVGWGCTGGIRK